MKTIGLLGGMSWESSLEYYRLINQGVKARLGGFHSAEILLYSVDFAEIERLQHINDWARLADILVAAGQALQRGGADCLVLCTNTMHKLAPELQQTLAMPMLHIADATANAVKAANINTVGLLGTRFTMEETFYAGRLRDQYGLNVLVPDAEEREQVHQVIFQELCQGQILPTSRETYQNIIRHLAQNGAQGIILGCTEIGLLLKADDCDLPLFDTTLLHAQAAVDFALDD